MTGTEMHFVHTALQLLTTPLLQLNVKLQVISAYHEYRFSTHLELVQIRAHFCKDCMEKSPLQGSHHQTDLSDQFIKAECHQYFPRAASFFCPEKITQNTFKYMQNNALL